MTFKLLAQFAQWTVLLFLLALLVTIAILLLSGQINAKRLLFGMRKDGTHFYNPLKLQLLITTLAIALEYLVVATQDHSGRMPRLPDQSLCVLGLSNAVYLGGKGWTLLRGITQAGGQ